MNRPLDSRDWQSSHHGMLLLQRWERSHQWMFLLQRVAVNPPRRVPSILGPGILMMAGIGLVATPLASPATSGAAAGYAVAFRTETGVLPAGAVLMLFWLPGGAANESKASAGTRRRGNASAGGHVGAVRQRFGRPVDSIV